MGVSKTIQTLEIPLISPGEEGELGAMMHNSQRHNYTSRIQYPPCFGFTQKNDLANLGFTEIGDFDSLGSDSDFTEGYDIDDALDVAGNGPFQFNLCFCICLV